MESIKINNLIILQPLLASSAGVECCQSGMNSTSTGITPSVSVMDQAASCNSVIANITVAKGILEGPDWTPIHINLFGHPGGVIGYSHINSGSNSNITATIYSFIATDSLFAVLHYDRGFRRHLSTQ